MKAGRPLWWAAGLSLCLLVAAASIAVLVRPGDPGATEPGASRPDRAERAVLASRTLADLEEAVASGRKGVSSGPPRVVADNAAAIGVRDFTLDYVAEDPGALSAGSDVWVAAVETTWAFRGPDRGLARTEVSFTFRIVDGRAVITAIGGSTGEQQLRRRPLWLVVPVTARRAGGVLVIAEGGPRVAERHLRLATLATEGVRRVLRDWSGGLVVEVPRSAVELASALAADPDEYARIAAVTTTVDGSPGGSSPVHIFVNAEVFGPLQPQGAQVVMTHEAAHVATGAATAAMPLWLVEGFADYVALRGVELPLAVTTSQIADRVRELGLPATLPADRDFDSGVAHLGASYEAAWLACSTLAEIGTEDELVAFYEAVRDGGDPAVQLRQIFGVSERVLIRAWRDRLEDLAS